MKEILYIQAGSLANYIGTHFWNTQETYLSFEEPENSTIRHDVSFKEVLHGPTVCTLVFVLLTTQVPMKT